jgi:hypothetical protein
MDLISKQAWCDRKPVHKLDRFGDRPKLSDWIGRLMGLLWRNRTGP